MDAVIFAGPTISRDEILSVVAGIDVDVRPPALRGDVLRACRARPRVIAIIDGVFDRVPSVWHKEILWALQEGIEVLGASSMGALRAAELEAFGMRGVGTIFEALRDGLLEDDDEVAISHATEEHGYRALSEALVNIRATLGAATAAGILRPDTAQAVERLAKALYYPERTYAGLLRASSGAGLPPAELGAFEVWLRNGRVDLKKQDALALLALLREAGAAAPRGKGFRFSTTDAWQALRASVENEAVHAPPQGAADAATDIIADELLASGRHGRVVAGALARAVCANDPRGRGAKMDDRAIQASIDDFRRQRGLFQPGDFEAWLAAQRITDDEVDPFFRREALVRRARVVAAGDAPLHVRDELRAMGIYGEVSARAEAKRAALARQGLQAAALADTGLTEPELWRWYFRALQRDVPADIDAYAAREHTDRAQLLAAVVREYCFDRAGTPSRT